jgi:hypothetical protein
LSKRNRVHDNTIEKKPGGSGGEQSGNPIPEARREPTALQKIRDILPTNGVKRFPNIKLEEQSRGLGLMESSSKVFHIEKVVMNASLINKCTLHLGDVVSYERR